MIGLGNMGGGMAARLAEALYELAVNRTPAKTGDAADGAARRPSRTAS